MNIKRYRQSNLLLDSSRLGKIDKLSTICHIGASFRTALIESARIGSAVDSASSLRLLEGSVHLSVEFLAGVLKGAMGYPNRRRTPQQSQVAKEAWGQVRNILSTANSEVYLCLCPGGLPPEH